ncbi:hypothetical protein Tco_1144611 [Tanacetum coccineum]
MIQQKFVGLVVVDVYGLSLEILSVCLDSISLPIVSVLDLELVPKENRLDIGKCYGRILHGFSPREPTFQVTLDAIALTTCYHAFLITADVPEVYMH